MFFVKMEHHILASDFDLLFCHFVFLYKNIYYSKFKINVKSINIHMFNSESFCPELWSQIEINTLGDYKICCLANYAKDYGLAYDENGKVMNVLTHSIQEAINSVTHKKHRLDLKENIKVNRCRNCYDGEHSTKNDFKWADDRIGVHGRSKRQEVNFITSKEIQEYVTVDTADLFTAADGSSSSKIVNLGLRLSNACNQKCIMCSPEYSSLWYDDWKALYGQNHSILPPEADISKYSMITSLKGRPTVDQSKWWESEIWWERFEEIAPQLRHIYFSGGEPLVAPALNEILNRLINNDYAKNIILRFDTNLSVINNKIIEKFKHFKKIYFCVSVDDIDDRYELIRFPGKYKTLVSNINELRANGLEIYYISCCIGIASIYAMLRVSELGCNLNIPVEFRFLEGPGWHDIRSLPKSAKLEIIETYKNHTGQSEIRTRWYDALIRLLEKYIDYENPKRIKTFVSTMDKLDKLRGTDWRTTLPDVYDILRRHCPEAGA
jgi:organic radical activating enzyme